MTYAVQVRRRRLGRFLEGLSEGFREGVTQVPSEVFLEVFPEGFAEGSNRHIELMNTSAGNITIAILAQAVLLKVKELVRIAQGQGHVRCSR